MDWINDDKLAVCTWTGASSAARGWGHAAVPMATAAEAQKAGRLPSGQGHAS